MAIVSIAIVSRRYALEVEAGELLPLSSGAHFWVEPGGPQHLVHAVQHVLHPSPKIQPRIKIQNIQKS